jgi:peptidase M23-like protein
MAPGAMFWYDKANVVGGRVNSIRMLLCAAFLGCWEAHFSFARQPEVHAAADVTASANQRPLPRPSLTPLVMQSLNKPIPVEGGDGRYHLVYELQLANFTGARIGAKQLEVLDAIGGAVLTQLDARQLAARLVVREHGATPGEFGASQVGILYLHVVIERQQYIPVGLQHRFTVDAGGGPVTATTAAREVMPPTDLVLDAPLRGLNYIAGDGCCDSTRHTRATLSLDGSAYNAQRFAIDWEQLDARGRIYRGDAKSVHSYVIYGEPVYAVADAQVVEASDGMEDSPPGALPNLSVDQADGNHVILSLGGGRFALYAHLQPHSVKVRRQQSVRRGQLLGLVGTSGNSSEPHLHFQVMDRPSSLASDGVPYLMRQFSASKRGASTAAFDRAILDGQPIETLPLPGPATHQRQLPLDLWITDLP